MSVRFLPTPLADAVLVELEPHGDERGFFARAFCEREFAEQGLPIRFPQANLSFNTSRGTLRGMHYQAAPHTESKLVRCMAGAIFDVIVDLRPASATRLSWFGAELSAQNGRALFVPEGFAHGFLTLAPNTLVHYQMGEFYSAELARGIRYDDPAIGIVWPAAPLVISERDVAYPDLDPARLEA